MYSRKQENAQEAAFIYEIHNDLRVERLHELWKKHSSLILTMTFFFLILIGGYGAWKQWQARNVTADARRYDEATLLIETGHVTEGAALLAALSAESDNSYRVLANLRQAAVFAKQKDGLATAITVWRQVTADSAVPRPYREAAALLTSINGISIISDHEIHYLLAPLLVNVSPWRFLALEIIAILAIQRDDTTTADVIFTRLADDLQAPASIRNRASTLRQALPPL